jgi:uncharacterized protein YndB with AHSA1/START domain
MSLKKDPDGRRSVSIETVMPGTPDQVWQAIASGPGISAWFVPTTLEPRVGGEMSMDFGGGMVSTAKITAWQPLVRFEAEAPGWMPGMPTMATEWSIQALDGGSCKVRVVHSLFASTDDWDNQLTSTESGWGSYFRVLRRYLEHFAGQASAQVVLQAMSSEPVAVVWKRLATTFGPGAPRAGQRFELKVAAGRTLAGVIESLDPHGDGNSVFAHLDGPRKGTLFLGAFACGGSMASVQAYLYGSDSTRVVDELREPLAAWLNGLFPAPSAP